MRFLFEPDFLRVVVIIVGIVVAIAGFTFFALRRRDEMLSDYFTSDEVDLEEDFFRRRAEKRTPRSKKHEVSSGESTEHSEETEWGDVSGNP